MEILNSQPREIKICIFLGNNSFQQGCSSTYNQTLWKLEKLFQVQPWFLWRLVFSIHQPVGVSTEKVIVSHRQSRLNTRTLFLGILGYFWMMHDVVKTYLFPYFDTWHKELLKNIAVESYDPSLSNIVSNDKQWFVRCLKYLTSKGISLS